MKCRVLSGPSGEVAEGRVREDCGCGEGVDEERTMAGAGGDSNGGGGVVID